MINRSLAIRIGCAVAVVSMALSACAGSGSGEGGDADTRTFSFLVTSKGWNVGYAPFVVAEEAGYFEEEGLKPQYQLVGGATQAVQLLQQGTGDAGAVTLQPVVVNSQKSRGGDLLLYSQFYRSNIYGIRVLADSPITSVKDLAGKKIGVTDQASAGVVTAKAILRNAGVDPDTATFVTVGVGAQLSNAVANKTVDALALFDTQYAILENGGTELRRLESPSVDNLVGGGFTASKARLDKDPDFYVKVARAVAKASLFTVTNPEAAVRMVWEAHPETRAKGDQTEALKQAKAVLQSRIENIDLEKQDEQWGSVSEKEIQAYIDFMRKSQLIKEPVVPDKIFTDEYLDQINDFDADKVRQDAKSWKP